MLTNKTILITSNEPWGDIWYTKHNYAFELSKQNKVFFINPPTNWKPSNLVCNKVYETKVTDNLSVIDYQNFLPLIRTKKNGINDPFYTNRINNFLVSKLIKSYIKKSVGGKVILWSFDPLRLYVPQFLGVDISIFHCADKYWLNSMGTHILCKRCDYIFLTSEHLKDEYSNFDKPKLLLSHGLGSDHFDIDIAKNTDLGLPVNDFGLFVGVIDGRIDYNLLEKALNQFPEQDFVFIGPLKENHIFEESFKLYIKLFKDKTYSNLHIIGPKHFRDLKYYINKSKFCISFMDPKWPGNTIGHHKTLVYLAQGKPVFQYRFKDYIGREDILYMSESHKGTIEQMKAFFKNGESPDLRNKRIDFAKAYRFDRLIARVSSYLETKA